ncbi:MAG: hypothetical protein WCP28_19690 [Actinomycetes bacterium]
MRLTSTTGRLLAGMVAIGATITMVAGVSTATATTTVTPSAAVGTRGDVTKFANSDVRGMMAYSMLLAKSVNYHSAYKIPAKWKLSSMKFFEADGCPSVKNSPESGCDGTQAKSASGFHRWIVHIAVVWKTPKNVLVAHTFSAEFMNGEYVAKGYQKQQLLDDHVFTLPKHNMTWAFAKERAWQVANPSLLPANHFPIVGNVRAPLTETLNDPTQWIFTVKTEGGADAYIGVNDKTGAVAPIV